MHNHVTIEVVGLADSFCSPFACDEDRSCGLSRCHPLGALVPAFEALTEALASEYGDQVTLKLTLIDTEVPPHIEKII